MYPIKRYVLIQLIDYIYIYMRIDKYLCTLKSYVRNKSHLEGSIAEGYITEESATFCSRFLHDVETKHDRE